ncbi:hypothetical protein GCM10027456_76990 [Kineosporia babensis]
MTLPQDGVLADVRAVLTHDQPEGRLTEDFRTEPPGISEEIFLVSAQDAHALQHPGDDGSVHEIDQRAPDRRADGRHAEHRLR